MTVALEHLRCKICHRAAEAFCAGMVTIYILLAQAKVSQHCMTFDVQDNIIWLQISVYDIMLVKMFQGCEDFADVDFRSVLAKSMLSLEVFSQITSWAEIEDHEELARGLERIMELNDKGMVQITEYILFC